MGKCCGGAVVRPTIPLFTAYMTTTDETLATVQFRKFVQMVINEESKQFLLASTHKLNYSLLQVILTAHHDCVIFLNESERIHFYATYPELRP